MRTIVVRHYKTLVNVWDQIMGWGDSPRAKGWERDLVYVDEVLRKKNIRLDAVHSSFLERARQTAMYHAKSRGINIIYDSAQLNEIDYGPELFRKEKTWVAQNIPKHKKDPDFIYPKGESFRQMQERSVNHILSLAEHFRDKTILVVVHAGVIRGLICHFLGLDLASNLTRKIYHRYVGDFHIEEGTCVRYEELGAKSGFVKAGIIENPWQGVPFAGPKSTSDKDSMIDD